MKKKVLYRTVVKVEILSEEPIPEGTDLDEMMAEADDGEFLGHTEVLEDNKPIVGKRAVAMVEKFGSDPDFFQMDSRGYDLADDDM